jgi:hypothetical protein
MANFVVKNNENKYLTFTVKDEDNEYFNLTGFVATIQIQKYGESSLNVSSSCNVNIPLDGKCRYLYDGTLSVGNYKAEIEFTYVSSGLKYITPTFDIDVVSNLPE